MASRIAVVVSQSQSKNPARRQLEEDLVTALLMEPGIDVTVIPNLYDLSPDGTGMLALQGIAGNMILLSWHYPRGAFWTLDRHGIRGQEGQTLLLSEGEDEEEEEDEDETSAKEDAPRVDDEREKPSRRIYCIDLRARDNARTFVDEIKRIANEQRVQTVGLGDWLQGSPSSAALQRYEQPTNDTALGPDAAPASGNGNGSPIEPAPSTADSNGAGELKRVEEEPGRRWYPVIDYSRCTNCMECIDFCLFGVYGVDTVETILVEQPDNCRKGCPACSRVCPENAIIFPQHKTPAIAGSASASAALKIDLSKLFGGGDALQTAAEERDEQLVLAGRDAVGMSVGIPKRQADREKKESDELDHLLDELDDLDL